MFRYIFEIKEREILVQKLFIEIFKKTRCPLEKSHLQDFWTLWYLIVSKVTGDRRKLFDTPFELIFKAWFISDKTRWF